MDEDKEIRHLKAGQRVVVSSGSYSDYGIMALAEVVADLDLDHALGEYFKLYPKQQKAYHFHEYGFLAWLIVVGYLRDIHEGWSELHLDDEGSIAVYPNWLSEPSEIEEDP